MISIDTKRLHLRNVLQNDVDVIFDYTDIQKNTLQC